jgi:uncharacterized protein (UPF0147 family)
MRIPGGFKHVKIRHLALFFVMMLVPMYISTAGAQTRKPLTNQDVVDMTKQALAPSIIVKAIEANQADFDVSAQALLDLKNAGVDASVMEAMLSAQGGKPSGSVEALHGLSAIVDDSTNPDPLRRVCSATRGCLIREGTEVQLKFATDLSSKTAVENDPVEFILDDDVKVGPTVVIPKGAHATAVVSHAHRAGMMGKGGELNIQLEYLAVADNHVRLRGTKGREGDSKVGATVALTVLFGPIGLIKHGKEVQIPAGTPLTAYLEQDIWLPPAR